MQPDYDTILHNLCGYGTEERNCEMNCNSTFVSLSLKSLFCCGFGFLCARSWHFFPFIPKCTKLFFPPSDLRTEGRKRVFVPHKILCLPGILICNKAPFILFQHLKRTLTRYPIKNLLCCQKNVKRLQTFGTQLSFTVQWRKGNRTFLALPNLAEPKGYQLTE